MLRARGSDDQVVRGVLTVFGASSLEECFSTYEMVGEAERSTLDEAVERVAVKAGATFWDGVEADFADVRSPSPVSSGVASILASPMRTYRIGRQWMSFGRSYWVEDAAGARVFKIAGKLRFPRIFSIRDVRGNHLYSVREKLLVLAPTFVISRDNSTTAVVRRTTTSGAAKDLFEIVLQSGEVLRAAGKLWGDGGVEIAQDNRGIASIRRQQLGMRETFWATVRGGADQALFLAVAMSIVESDVSRGDAS
jgi:uncharacterized protein YxjI